MNVLRSQHRRRAQLPGFIVGELPASGAHWGQRAHVEIRVWDVS